MTRYTLRADPDTHEFLIADSQSHTIIARCGRLGREHLQELIDLANRAVPLAALLLEAKREHDEGMQTMGCGLLEEGMNKPCDCGAEDFNNRIDAVLNGD